MKTLFPLLFCILLTACSFLESEKQIELNGASDSWSVEGYKIEFERNSYNIGEGIIKRNSEQEYLSDFFQYSVYVAIENEDIIFHRGSYSGAEINIAEKSTGSVKGGSLLNEKGKPVTIDDIQEIYMIITWRDSAAKQDLEEKVVLYKSID